jgi:UDP-N-acetylmuramoyl-tripeptide--D-alanyl-D-alanine ligase
VEEGGVLSLVHVLYGIQPKGTRQMPALPAHWQQIGFHEAVTDSRDVMPGALFVALAGERTDGHNFLADVAGRGASGALVSATVIAQRREALNLGRPWALVEPATGHGLEQAPQGAFLLIAVDDPLMALQRLAVYHRRQLTPTVIGITGSVGKTSTKEVVAAVLGRRYRTLKSKRSFNTEVTVPATMLNLTPADEVAVLEMGMWAAGEIRFLANLARPSLGIVTNVGPSHLERLKTLEAIARAKAELVEALPAGGTAILNYDDELVRAMAQRTQARTLLYGLDPAADLWADEIVSRGLEGIGFRAHYGGESVTLKLPLLGRHSVHTALAGAAAGLALGMNWEEIVDGLRSGDEQLRLLAVPGAGGAMIIDDTYNAAPASSLAALNLLAELEGRRIAVMGDMLELGSYEEEAHRLVGRRVPAVADLLLAVGERAVWIAEEARACGMPPDAVMMARTNSAAIEQLLPILRRGDYVLVKGSRGVALEQIVTALQRRPEEENQS